MKKLLLSLAVAVLSLPIFAVNLKDFSLSVEPLFGMKYGQIDEYVFLKNPNYSDDKVSELNWEIKPELYYGLKIRGGWKGFFEESFFTAGIPMKTGSLYDSDWNNNDPLFVSKSVATTTSNYKTNFSESDNYLNYDISFGFKGGYEFKIFEIFSIKPAIAFEYQNIKFTGKNGQGWYGKKTSDGYYSPYTDTNNREISDFSGKNVIAYHRVSDFLWLGSDLSAELPCHLTVNAGFFVAAYIYAISYDTHFIRSLDFADKTTDSFSSFKWNLGISHKIAKRHFININASWFYMKVIHGDTYKKYSSQSSYTKTTDAEGGAGANWFDLSISYKFQIF